MISRSLILSRSPTNWPAGRQGVGRGRSAANGGRLNRAAVEAAGALARGAEVQCGRGYVRSTHRVRAACGAYTR
eukprot:4690805-Prymnesium_polylepis.1